MRYQGHVLCVWSCECVCTRVDLSVHERASFCSHLPSCFSFDRTGQAADLYISGWLKLPHGSSACSGRPVWRPVFLSVLPRRLLQHRGLCACRVGLLCGRQAGLTIRNAPRHWQQGNKHQGCLCGCFACGCVRRYPARYEVQRTHLSEPHMEREPPRDSHMWAVVAVQLGVWPHVAGLQCRVEL